MPARLPAGTAALTVCLFAATAAGQPPAAASPPVLPPATADVNPAAATAPARPNSWPDKVGGKDLRSWLHDLKESPDGSVREAAVKAIPLFGPSARKDVVKPLITAMRDSDPGVRINAILTLGLVGTENEKDAKDIIEALTLAITNSGIGSATRLHATRSLANYGPLAADRGVPVLVSIAGDPAWETRHAVAEALGQIGRPAKEDQGANPAALKGLLHRLGEEKSAAVRLEVVQSLIVLGPPAYKKGDPADYIRVIRGPLDTATARLKAEKEKSIQVWLLMLTMLYDGQALTDANIRKLTDYVGGPDVPARVAALRALALLGEKAKPALPGVAAALQSEEPAVAAEAVAALAALGKTAAPELPSLRKFKDETKDAVLKHMAEQAIDAIEGKKPAPAAAQPPVPPKK